MARNFDAGNNDHVTGTPATGGAVISIAGWGAMEAGADTTNLLFSWGSGNRFSIQPQTAAAWRVQYYTGSYETLNATTTVSADGTWHHFGAAFDPGNTDEEVYYDGVSENTASTGNALQWAAGLVDIGNNSADTREFGGGIAEIAGWNRRLSAAEFAALALGYSPLFFRRSLIFYLPMIADFRELMANITFTDTQGTTLQAHPPMIYPQSPILGVPIIAAAGNPYYVYAQQ